MIHWVLAILVVILGFVVRSTRKPNGYPPGPRWVPFLGDSEFKVLSRKLGGMHMAAQEMSKRYNSNVLGFKFGREKVVVITGYDTIKQVLLRDDFNNRPDNFFLRLRCMGTRRGITAVDGPLWHRHRNFLIRHFKRLGFGDRRMELLIKEELNDILQFIGNNKGAVRIEKVIAPSVLNVLWTLTCGSRMKTYASLLELFEERRKAFDISGGILAQYPWLRFVAPAKTGYNLILEFNRKLKAFVMEIIYDHYETWSEGREDDFIYSFISEMKRGGDKSFNEDQLVMVCLDIFFGGAATTSNTVDFAFLAMVLNPDVQRKVQKHIDDVIKEDRDICYSDRAKLPFVEAVLLETLRMYPVVPLAGPRTVAADTKVDNFIIPKNTTVLMSMYSIHMDKEFWCDPEVFRPQRFLNEDGKIINAERVLNFGLGKRRCLGEALPRMFLFIIFSNILRKYSLQLALNSNQPKGKPIPGITLSTEDYTVRFTERLNADKPVFIK